jgi:hypothetical protein
VVKLFRAERTGPLDIPIYFRVLYDTARRRFSALSVTIRTVIFFSPFDSDRASMCLSLQHPLAVYLSRAQIEYVFFADWH